MVVASCAVLEALPGDPDLLGEEKTTLLSIVSVSISPCGVGMLRFSGCILL